MINSMKINVLAAAIACAVAAPATAATLDFTDNSVGTSGSLSSGITWEVTSNFPAGLNRNEAYDGGSLAAIAPLVGDNDGFGVSNDEISNGIPVDRNFQTITVTFSEAVKVTTAYFLDVYFGNGIFGEQAESARMLVAGSATSDNPFDAEVFGTDENPLQAGVVSPGFAMINGEFKGTAFTFFAGPGIDDSTADVSLAGLTIAPVPVPAGLLLLGTALGGLGLARRRKNA